MKEGPWKKQGWRRVPENVNFESMEGMSRRFSGKVSRILKIESASIKRCVSTNLNWTKCQNEESHPLIHCAEVIEIPGGVESSRTGLPKVAAWCSPEEEKSFQVPYFIQYHVVELYVLTALKGCFYIWIFIARALSSQATPHQVLKTSHDKR